MSFSFAAIESEVEFEFDDELSVVLFSKLVPFKPKKFELGMQTADLASISADEFRLPPCRYSQRGHGMAWRLLLQSGHAPNRIFIQNLEKTSENFTKWAFVCKCRSTICRTSPKQEDENVCTVHSGKQIAVEMIN
ncbi:hypothetical protein DAPPUDRAFT_277476 [Daphnia pulex]|uniref:Uncharacterized protein n=1 Tax=Daphnia pulex TaxID=6669 RepID=E9I6D6_DAPPU|nr:hypothetical protein DAPPUDRAFT_277476 [Daphnia pulex]|eukprot:EFX60444.1 hypothetical protein DAPPUDRAFT_277476 [Daphnia pulex]